MRRDSRGESRRVSKERTVDEYEGGGAEKSKGGVDKTKISRVNEGMSEPGVERWRVEG